MKNYTLDIILCCFIVVLYSVTERTKENNHLLKKIESSINNLQKEEHRYFEQITLSQQVEKIEPEMIRMWFQGREIWWSPETGNWREVK